MAHLYRLILMVSDITHAEQVYSQLLETTGRYVSPSRLYFNCGGTILVCCDLGSVTDPSETSWKPHPDQYLYFAVPGLEAKLALAIALGCTVLEPGIFTRPWGERLFYAHDPFGNPICFVDERTIFTGFDNVSVT